MGPEERSPFVVQAKGQDNRNEGNMNALAVLRKHADESRKNCAAMVAQIAFTISSLRNTTCLIIYCNLPF